MKKVLIIAHMGQMIAQFNRDNIKILQDLGYEVHIAANFTSGHNTMKISELETFVKKIQKAGVVVHQVEFERGLGNVKNNLTAWKQLNKIFNKQNFNLIHCQSPLGGVFGRLIGKKFGIKVIYTAHGFHFFKGGSKINWLIFYPVEKFLAKYTNTLVTINKEDYEIAKKFNENTKVYKIPGVGINVNNIQKNAKETNEKAIRKELKIPEDAFVISSVGETNQNKNHLVVMKALQLLNDDSIYYLICGKGNEFTNLSKYIINNNLSKNIKLLGYRKDITEILSVSDVFAFPSKREGLGLSAIEAMAVGLPLVTSNASGILEYSVDKITGFVNDADDYKGFASSINKLKSNRTLCLQMGKINRKKANLYDSNIVNKIMTKIYLQIEG